jgi:hypothetical protein
MSNTLVSRSIVASFFIIFRLLVIGRRIILSFQIFSTMLILEVLNFVFVDNVWCVGISYTNWSPIKMRNQLFLDKTART